MEFIAFHRILCISLDFKHIMKIMPSTPWCKTCWPLDVKVIYIFKKAYKTYAILFICSKRLQNDVFQMLEFSTYLSNIVKWLPRAPVELPETPRDASDNPDKHKNQCQWTQNHVKFTGLNCVLLISLHSIGFYGFHCIP